MPKSGNVSGRRYTVEPEEIRIPTNGQEDQQEEQLEGLVLLIPASLSNCSFPTFTLIMATQMQTQTTELKNVAASGEQDFTCAQWSLPDELERPQVDSSKPQDLSTKEVVVEEVVEEEAEVAEEETIPMMIRMLLLPKLQMESSMVKNRWSSQEIER